MKTGKQVAASPSSFFPAIPNLVLGRFALCLRAIRRQIELE